MSASPYKGLNLATHVGDDASAVAQNRIILMEALDAPNISVLVPNQVHGDHIAVIENQKDALSGRISEELSDGADGVLVMCEDVAALLCFADCVPLIIVAPDGKFAVVHSGWRGVMAEIASKAVRLMVDIADNRQDSSVDSSEFNVYIGPHICGNCFETSLEIAENFVSKFGEEVALDDRHISLERALCISLMNAGVSPERIASVNACTQCRSNDFYSYRASGGVCGRHGAVAFRHMQTT